MLSMPVILTPQESPHFENGVIPRLFGPSFGAPRSHIEHGATSVSTIRSTEHALRTRHTRVVAAKHNLELHFGPRKNEGIAEASKASAVTAMRVMAGM